MSYESIYFNKAGKDNTERTLVLSREYAVKHGIKFVVIATTQGQTASLSLRCFQETNIQLVVVTHSVGFSKPGISEIPLENVAELRTKGALVLTTTHALAGVGRSFRKQLGTWQPVEILAQTLKKCFGDGTKVCLEIAIMAADAGLVPVAEDIICIAGTGRGADTAWVLRPSHAHSLFDLKMRKIIAKPEKW